MLPRPPVLIGMRPRAFRDEMTGWFRGQGYDAFVTGAGREAVDFLVRTPGAVSFLDRDLERFDGEEVWRVVHPQGRHRLVLMAEHRTTDLWLRALSEGVATVLPLPSERDAVLYALRVALRGGRRGEPGTDESYEAPSRAERRATHGEDPTP